ncbi:MAG: ABC transporter permease [Chloroflexota bacterium]|nr:ABC transporter permease [Chloroflexota bacterium]
MLRFIVRRVAFSVLIVLGASAFVFGLSRAAGDPRLLYLTEYVTPEIWDQWGKAMGLDKPLVAQYFIWLSKAVRGDFGTSLRDQVNALTVIARRVPATAQLAAGAFTFALAVGIPLGVLSAVKRGSILDYIGRTFALLGQAMPAFWLGIMLVLLFAVQLDWLPSARRGGISHFILPSITLGWPTASGILRLVRSAMLEILDSEYIKFARAKGVSNALIVWKHALRNAIIAPLTFAGMMLAAFLTGAVVTETVFAWPGLGRLAVLSVFSNDFPVVTGIVMLFTVLYVIMNLFVDVAYAYIDPRIRYQ